MHLRTLRRRTNLARYTIAIAGISVCAGANTTRGAFVVTPVDMGNTTVLGATYTTFVFTAAGDDTTGTLLQSADITTQVAQSNAGAFGIDIEHVNNSTGTNAKYTANLDGSLQPGEVGESPTAPGTIASQNAGQSVYGDPGAGTFGGFGFNFNDGPGIAGSWSPDITDNPFITQGAGSTAFVFTEPTEFSLGVDDGSAAFWTNVKLAGTGHLDSNLETSTTSVGVVGGINNAPTLYSLETLFAAFNGSSTTFQPARESDPDPFYQVVIKAGTAFTLSGQLVFNMATVNYSTVIGQVFEPPFVLTFTNSPPSNLNLAVTFHMTGAGHGVYNPQTQSVTGTAQTIGYLDASGFNPATDVEVYGFQIDSNGTPATGSMLASIVAQMDATLQPTDSNWNAYTLPSGPTSGPGVPPISILEAAGDNVEVVFPDVTDDAYLSWNFSGLPGVTITQVSVVPEPRGIALLVLGGTRLLTRKRRRTGAH